MLGFFPGGRIVSRIVGFSGYYQMSNYGDDLFARTSVLAATRYWPSLVPRLVGAREEGASSMRGIPISAYQGLGVLGKACRVYAGLSDLLGIDKLVFSGGSLFHSENSRATSLMCRLAEKRRIGLSAIGVSIGPFASSSAERRIKQLLGRFEYLSVRDRASLDIARSFNLACTPTYGSDLAFLYPRVCDADSNENTEVARSIGFSPCDLVGDEARARSYCDAFVRSVVRARRDRDLPVCILNLNEHPQIGDDVWCRYTAEQLADRRIPHVLRSYGQLGIRGTWDLVSTFSAYMTVRLHGAVTACATGTPYLLYEYHRKCTDFLDEVGYPEARRMSADMGEDCALMRLLEAPDSSGLGPWAADCARRSLSNFTAAPWAVPSGTSLQ